MPHLAAPARLLETTKGKRGVKDVVAVDPDIPCAELLCHLMASADIPGPDGRCEAVLTVIGDGDDLIFIVIGNGSDDGPKDLFADDGHFGTRIDQDSGLHKVPLALTRLSTGHRFCTFA